MESLEKMVLSSRETYKEMIQAFSIEIRTLFSLPLSLLELAISDLWRFYFIDLQYGRGARA